MTHFIVQLKINISFFLAILLLAFKAQALVGPLPSKLHSIKSSKNDPVVSVSTVFNLVKSRLPQGHYRGNTTLGSACSVYVHSFRDEVITIRITDHLSLRHKAFKLKKNNDDLLNNSISEYSVKIEILDDDFKGAYGVYYKQGIDINSLTRTIKVITHDKSLESPTDTLSCQLTYPTGKTSDILNSSYGLHPYLIPSTTIDLEISQVHKRLESIFKAPPTDLVKSEKIFSITHNTPLCQLSIQREADDSITSYIIQTHDDHDPLEIVLPANIEVASYSDKTFNLVGGPQSSSVIITEDELHFEINVLDSYFINIQGLSIVKSSNGYLLSARDYYEGILSEKHCLIPFKP